MNANSKFGFSPDGQVVVVIDAKVEGRDTQTCLTMSPAAARDFASHLVDNAALAEGKKAQNVGNGANFN